jgi:hypothetical protein
VGLLSNNFPVKNETWRVHGLVDDGDNLVTKGAEIDFPPVDKIPICSRKFCMAATIGIARKVRTS